MCWNHTALKTLSLKSSCYNTWCQHVEEKKKTKSVGVEKLEGCHCTEHCVCSLLCCCHSCSRREAQWGYWCLSSTTNPYLSFWSVIYFLIICNKILSCLVHRIIFSWSGFPTTKKLNQPQTSSYTDITVAMHTEIFSRLFHLFPVDTTNNILDFSLACRKLFETQMCYLGKWASFFTAWQTAMLWNAFIRSSVGTDLWRKQI